MKNIFFTLLSIVAITFSSCSGNSEKKSEIKTEKLEQAAKAVTPENYTRAQTDAMFTGLLTNAGGSNKLWYVRNPTPLDQQPVVRMNRDALYAGGVYDAKDGLTIEFPEMPDDRYASVQIIDNDHYEVIEYYEPGTYKIETPTRYVFVNVRIQFFDPFDKEEIAMVNKLQDAFIITSPSNQDFPKFSWDKKVLDSLTVIYEAESTKYDTYAGMMDVKGKADEKIRHLAAAAAWGLFPETEATYLKYTPKSREKGCYKATYSVPDNNAFWSITVYGDDGKMKSDKNLVNSANAKFNNDGTFTVYFGSEEECGDVLNRVDAPEGWNFLLRVYLPGESVLNGEYKLPDVELIK